MSNEEQLPPAAAELPLPMPELIDEGEVLAAFAEYGSTSEDDSYPPSVPAAAYVDSDAQTPPKERYLAAMRLEAKVEAVVFAAQKPMKAQEILDIIADTSVSLDDVQATLDLLTEAYEDRCGGFRLQYCKRLGYQFQTAPAAGPIMERMFASRPRPISRAALETLSIIAYRQPVTRAEVEFIRGVDAGSIFKTLLERELIKCVGRKEIVGRPMLFGTTDEFLAVFNLGSIKDLPPLAAFQPSRELVDEASERLASGPEDELVDVEAYIEDNTRGAEEPTMELQVAAEVAAEQASSEHGDILVVEDVAASEASDGSDANSEMAVPVRAGVAPGGGDVDQ